MYVKRQHLAPSKMSTTASYWRVELVLLPLLGVAFSIKNGIMRAAVAFRASFHPPNQSVNFVQPAARNLYSFFFFFASTCLLEIGKFYYSLQSDGN